MVHTCRHFSRNVFPCIPFFSYLFDCGFPGGKHGITPYLKPKNVDHPIWQAKYNDGQSFIWGCGEHLFAQLYVWATCWPPCTKFGMNWDL